MAGRPNLVVTQDELSKLYQHIKTLPFHKIIEQNFLREYEINPEKLLTQNLALVKKCRYEKNDFDKRMTYFNLLKQSIKPTQLEQSILALERLSTTSADAYFTMHKSLDQLKRSAKNEFLEKNIAVEIQKALDPKTAENKAESRNQRNAELIFLGAAVKKLLNYMNISEETNDIEKIGRAIKSSILINGLSNNEQLKKYIEHAENTAAFQLINKTVQDISTDVRNPNKK